MQPVMAIVLTERFQTGRPSISPAARCTTTQIVNYRTLNVPTPHRELFHWWT